jgi:histidine kinase
MPESNPQETGPTEGTAVSHEAAIAPDVALSLEGITEVLVAVARGDFGVRASRSHQGDAWDVLSFLVNETAEEVRRLVEEVHLERQELVEAQEKLHRTEKLAALGELAGGVAHELNQPLTVMQTLAELLLEKPEDTIGSRARELQLISAAAKRMGRIVAAIRTFGRRAPLNLGPLDLRVPIGDALTLLEEPLSAARIEVRMSVEDGAPWVAGDGEALQQVFINLLSNARDVLCELPDGAPRCISIATVVREGGVRVIFDDNGPGVPDSVVDRLFDPFFSTKSVGRGTGLGLSISHGIIAEHRGTLVYSANRAGGASFIVDLPGAAGGAV